jgi:hypothetical protein
LPKLYYCHNGLKKNLVKKSNKKNQPKRPNQNSQIQIVLSKMAFWSSWTWGQKNHSRGFLIEISGQKNHDFL